MFSGVGPQAPEARPVAGQAAGGAGPSAWIPAGQAGERGKPRRAGPSNLGARQFEGSPRIEEGNSRG